MIRITTSDGPALTTITVDGRLSADCIDAVETCCDQATSRGKRARLVLRDISAIDGDGDALLRRLAAKGVSLRASGIYTSYVIDSIQQDCRPQTGRRG